MLVIPVVDSDDARLAEFRKVLDPDLLRRGSLFVAEGRLVVRRLLTMSKFRVVSLLVNQAAFESLADVLPAARPDLPVFVCPSEAMKAIVGFNLHRGCLALSQRPEYPPLDDVMDEADVMLVLEAVTDADNMGSVFRNAAAFGADGVLLSPTCCDPLYRKAVRTSMGAVLRVRYARLDGWPACLLRIRAAGLALVALTPRGDAMGLDEFVTWSNRPRRIALLIGTEGSLSPEAEAYADIRVRIPIDPDVDSLNLATAVGIALHRLSGIGRGREGERAWR